MPSSEPGHLRPQLLAVLILILSALLVGSGYDAGGTLILGDDDDAATDDDDIASDDDDTSSDDDDASGDDDDTGSTEFGPPNGWWHADEDDVPPGLSGTGLDAGDVPDDFVLTDQDGNQVELYQFYGKVVLLHLGALWTPLWDQYRDVVEDLWVQYEDDGLVCISIVVEDAQANPPDPTEAAQAAGDATHVILSGDPSTLFPFIQASGYYPTAVLIDRQMQLVEPNFTPIDAGPILQLL